MINKIIDETKATIDIEDDGLVMITSASMESAQKAMDGLKSYAQRSREIFKAA